MYFVPILTTSLFMVITCMNLNGDLCWMNMTIRWERELGLSTFRNRPDIVGFGDNLSAENVFLVGRGLVSFKKKKKRTPTNLFDPLIILIYGWDENFWRQSEWEKVFLEEGLISYRYVSRISHACSLNFWQHAPRRQLSLNFWIRSNFFENSKGRTLFQAGIILWKSFSDSYVGGFFFRISESEAKEWMFPI